MTTCVSIIINNYNYGRFIRRAIESALAQTHPDIDLVIVDDGSTDGSAAIIREYEGRARLVLRANGGQGAALNSGFAASRGDIVMFLDSDDMLAPEAAAEVVAAWRPGTAKAQFSLDWIDAEGRPLRGGWSAAVRAEDVGRHLARTCTCPAPPMSGNAFARGALEKVMPVPESPFRLYADSYLNATVALHGAIRVIDRTLGAYRVHGSNQSEQGGIDLARMRRVMQSHLARDEAMRRMGSALGSATAGCSCLNLPLHVRYRLLSLKLDPSTHPFPDDRAWILARRGIAAALGMPGMSAGRRAYLGLHFTLLALMPRGLVRRYLPYVVDRNRWQLPARRRRPEPQHPAPLRSARGGNGP
jgi:hypothetical protein